MKRFFTLAFFCVLLLSFMLISCQTSVEPPFEVQTAAERRESMTGGFGEYVMSHPKADRVLVHREMYGVPSAAEAGELPVDLYYPPGFRFNKPLPAVIIVGGNVNWSSNVTLAELLAANGFLTLVPETLQMVKDDAPERLTALLSRVLTDDERLFIDTQRLAIWTEGHPSSLALQVAMDREAGFHDGLQAAVFVSPVMTFAQNSFDYDPAWIDPQLPVLISRGEDDSFYEVKASVKMFRQAAEEAGSEVRYLEVAGGNHNWMTERDTEASHQTIKAEIEFLKSHL